MYEVFTCGDVPYHNLPRNQDVVEYVSKKRRCLPCPRNCSPSIYNNIMVKCMQYVSFYYVQCMLKKFIIYYIHVYTLVY